jgi:agmatinase
LRDGYLGQRYSHAAAMRRVLDHAGVSLVSVGIRAISKDEVAFAAANRERVTIHWARERARWDIEAMVAPLAGRPVYVTLDIDVLDAAAMPATGTPTPGGLAYGEVLAVLRAACRAGHVVGADLVELAPIAGLHACDYTAAALAYKLLAYALAKQGSDPTSGRP